MLNLLADLPQDLNLSEQVTCRGVLSLLVRMLCMPCHVNSFVHVVSVARRLGMLDSRILDNMDCRPLSSIGGRANSQPRRKLWGKCKCAAAWLCTASHLSEVVVQFTQRSFLLNSDTYTKTLLVNLLDMFLHVMLCHISRRILSQQ